MEKSQVIEKLWRKNYEPSAGIARRVEYILSQFNVAPDVVNDVLGEIYLADTTPFAIGGAYEVMDMIMSQGSRLVIWTQGDPAYQQAKLSHFGLDQLRARPEQLVAVDKCQALETFENIKEHDSYVVIDDRLRFLSCATSQLSALVAHEARKTTTIQVDPDTQKHPFVPTHQIPTIATLLDKSYRHAFGKNTLVFLDFDRTLFDPEGFTHSVILPSLVRAAS